MGNLPTEPICSVCKNLIADDAFVNTVNAAGGYGSEPVLVCDPCMTAAKDGSYLAEYRDRHHPELRSPPKAIP